MTVPYLDMKAQFNELRAEIMPEILSVLENSQFILGPKVSAFETAFAAFCGTNYAVGVNSGTAALQMALTAADIGPGDEVITTSMTFMATIAAILYVGATPVLVDIAPHSFTMDPSLIEQKITPRTRAIIPVHLYGQMADMQVISQIGQKHNLLIIEDAAQAHGARWQGKEAGSWGAMGCFSFYPGKNLGAFGEAGAVVTSDKNYLERMQCHRDWGQKGKGNHVLAGFNARMDGVQGAVLGVKLRHLERWTNRRRQIAALYNELLKDCASIRLPAEHPDAVHVYHVYSIQHENRDALRAELANRDIATGIHYPVPVHKMPCYKGENFARTSLPDTEKLSATQMSLPICPMMSDDQVVEVSQAIIEISGSD